MLREFLESPQGQALLTYLLSPQTIAAVVLPGLLSLCILAAYTWAGRVSRMLQLIWWIALPISYLCAYWVVTPERESLYIFSAFSVACVFLLFFRKSLPPALAFALTFFSLLSVDLSHAFARALSGAFPVERFYMGVGGAGVMDSLLVMPLVTAILVPYARTRIQRRGERLVDI